MRYKLIEKFHPGNKLIVGIILIFIFGLGLRLFSLGEEAYWNDEAAQILVATSPSIKTLIAGTAAHTLAMPLDYIVTRIFAKFFLDPTILRLPSVIWSSFTIVIVAWYTSLLFAKERYMKFMVLFSAWLTAITPIYIYYAQEVRFYASMSAFFWLASACILNFLTTPKFRNWIYVLISMLVGVFFHPFVLFAIVNVLFIFLLENQSLLVTLKNKRKEILMLLAVFIFCVLVFLFWIRTANLTTSDKLDPFGIAKNITSFVLQGLNLKFVQFCADTKLFGAWEIFQGLLLISSIAILIRKSQSKLVVFLFITIFSQVLVIAAVNIYRSYWIIYRQIIYLIPYIYMLISKGMASLIDYFHVGENKTKQNVLVCILVLSALVAVSGRWQEIYRTGKSNADEVADSIINLPKLPDRILVDPGYEVKVYELYLGKLHHIDGIEILPFSINDIGPSQSTRVLILPGPIEEILPNITNYSEILAPQKRCAGNRFVYLLDN